MTTVDEFRKAVRIHFARSRRLVWTIIGSGLLLFAGGWLGVQFLIPIGEAQYLAVAGLLLGLVVVVVFAVGAATLCNEGKLGMDSRLFCPNCARPMQIQGSLVMATGICPGCGSRALADWSPPPIIETSRRWPRPTVGGRLDVAGRRSTSVLLRLYGLMFVGLYGGLTLLLIKGAFAIPMIRDVRLLIVTLIPIALCALTPLILAPGPRRDWTFMSLIALQTGFADLYVVGMAIDSALKGGSIAIGAILVVAMAVLGVHGIVRLVQTFLLPQPCPACARRTLLHAARQHPGIQTFHDYFWCMNCHERLKRLRNGPWEQAWNRSDDRFYWLWNLRECVHAALDFLGRKMYPAR